MEPSGLALLALAAATLVGAAVQAITGFGFAILAAPVFLAVLDTIEAVPLLAALHIVQSAMLLPSLWAKVPVQLFRRLLLGAGIGCPLGLMLFSSLDVRGLKLAAGAAILVVSALLYVRSRGRAVSPPQDGGNLEPVAAGVMSGVLTALLVMPGPPLMILLMRQPLPPETARALSLTFFAACYVAVTAMNLATGTLTSASWRTAIALVAPVVAGTIAGRQLASRLPERHFMAALYLLLVLAGVGAIASAL